MATAEQAKDQQKRQYRLMRKARRREYQDMMFSMKQAGLNPMLASGAQPGHMQIATGTDQGPAHMASAAAMAQAASSLSKAPSEIAGRQMASALAGEQIANTHADTANKNVLGQNLALESGRIAAETAEKNSQAALHGAKAIESAKQQGFITENTARVIVQRQIDEQIRNAQTGGNIISDPLGYVAHGLERGLAGGKEVYNYAKERWLQEAEARAERERDEYRRNKNRHSGR